MRGKQRILGKGVIGDHGCALRQQFRQRPPLLVVAAEQEEYLRLEGIALAVGIKIGQEWVFFEHLEHQRRGECWLQQARQTGFAHSDDAFDGNIHHEPSPGMNGIVFNQAPSAAATACGCSSISMCPASGTNCRRAPGMASARYCA